MRAKKATKETSKVIKVKGVAGEVDVKKATDLDVSTLGTSVEALSNKNFPTVVSEAQILGATKLVAIHTANNVGLYTPRECAFHSCSSSTRFCF